MKIGSKKILARVSGATAILALSAGAAWGQVGAPPATAQNVPTAAAGGDLEAIVVTSSRLQNTGFDAPTPTTVVSSADLAKTAYPSVFDALIQIPAMQGSTGTTYETGSTSTGLQGVSALSLRGLSPLRTLTLFDGERVVGANYNGVVDVDQLPQILIQRVEVVTGGASASWGSDAVAGVVNMVTDKKFEGFKVNLEGGRSTYDDNGTTNIQMAAGTNLLDHKGHVEVAAEYDNDAGVMAQGAPSNNYGPKGVGGRTWDTFPGLQQNTIAGTPAGSPQYVYNIGAQNTQATKYGLINSGPLTGIAFGANGTPYQYQYAGGYLPVPPKGTLPQCISSTCFPTPGEPGDQSEVGQPATLVQPLIRANVYGRFSYDITDDTEVFATINYGVSNIQSIPTDSYGKPANTIQCANPYLPASVAASCAADGITSFTYGLLYPFPNFQDVLVERIQRRFVVGADGKFSVFGKDWSWDTYLEHGENTTGLKITNMILNGRFNAAINPIVGPGGQIECASAATRLSGCEPLDVIGQVPLPPNALAYVIPSSGPFQNVYQRQEAFAANLHGAPFADWAGDISMAAGFEARQEAYIAVADPYGNGVTAQSPNSVAYPADPALSAAGNNWYAGNYHDGKGQYEVEEGYFETGVPLFKMDSLGKADVDVAGRFEDYSESGSIWTWKYGLVWDTPVDGLRFRALRSRDVRAPNLSEAFAPNTTINASIQDPFLAGNPTINMLQVSKGNAALSPEKSLTDEVGIVWQPDFIHGFRTSVDYYHISIDGLISALPIQNLVQLCYQGETAYCGQNIITTTGGVPIQDGGHVTAVVSQVFNLATTVTDGIDVESAYAFQLPAVPGTFAVHGLANHTYKFYNNPGIPGQAGQEYAGAIANFSTSTTYNATYGTVPFWKVNLEQDYNNDKFGFSVIERFISGGTFNNNYVQCTAPNCPLPTTANPTINYNHVGSATYLDLGATYNVTDKAVVYAKVNNLTNVPPPMTSNGPNITGLYDVIGRMYYVGFRFNTN